MPRLNLPLTLYSLAQPGECRTFGAHRTGVGVADAAPATIEAAKWCAILLYQGTLPADGPIARPPRPLSADLELKIGRQAPRVLVNR